MKYISKGKKIIVLLLVFALAGSIAATEPVSAKTTSGSLVSVVKKSAGSSFPFTSKDLKTSKRMIFGIMATRLNTYAAYEKISGSGSSSKEYFLFIGQASTAANAKRNAASLKRYITRENSSMGNYLSEEGKKLFQAVQTGSKGKWCWLVMVSPSAAENKKAVNAIRKKM
jgi:hypothetical protein